MSLVSGIAIALLLVILTISSYIARLYAERSTLVGSGGDAFWADPSAQENERRGRAVNLMLHSLAELPPQATLAVVPEGAMINYLSRRENPTGYINLMPPEVIMFGQERIAAAFATHPPDYVLLVHSDPSDYGYRSFADYAGQIAMWVQEHYEAMPTARDAALPMLLMKRK